MSTSKPARTSYGILFELVPTAPVWKVDWQWIWPLWQHLGALDSCPQDPHYHGEGDVGTHTRMVVEALVSLRRWRDLSTWQRSCVFWAAVLHDIGKPMTTSFEENGRITSRGHSRVGARIARQLLWEAGAPFDWREQVCGLIACHQIPFWLIERKDCQRQAIKTSWKCQADLVCLHAEADAMGRICADQQSILDNVPSPNSCSRKTAVSACRLPSQMTRAVLLFLKNRIGILFSKPMKASNAMSPSCPDCPVQGKTPGSGQIDPTCLLSASIRFVKAWAGGRPATREG